MTPNICFLLLGRFCLVGNIQRGEIYLVDWNPARGSEQAGQRPALVIQNDIANGVAGYPVTIVCAISSKLKGYPSMVRVQPTAENGLTQFSEINSAQIMTVQKERLIHRLGFLSASELKQVEQKLAYMLNINT